MQRDQIAAQIDRLTKLEVSDEKLLSNIMDLKKENAFTLQKNINTIEAKTREFEQMLMIPGLIGPGEPFENMRGFLSYIYSYQQRSFKDLELKIKKVIENNIDDIDKKIDEKVLSVKQNIENQLFNHQAQKDDGKENLIDLIHNLDKRLNEQQDTTKQINDKLSRVERLALYELPVQIKQNRDDEMLIEQVKQLQSEVQRYKSEMDLSLGDMKVSQIQVTQEIKKEMNDRFKSVQKKFDDLKNNVSTNNLQSKSLLQSKNSKFRDRDQNSNLNNINTTVFSIESDVFNEQQKLSIIHMIREQLQFTGKVLVNSSNTNLDLQKNQSNEFGRKPSLLQTMKTDIGIQRSSTANRTSNQNQMEDRNSNDTIRSKVEDMPSLMNLISPTAKINSRRNIKVENESKYQVQQAFLSAFDQAQLKIKPQRMKTISFDMHQNKSGKIEITNLNPSESELKDVQVLTVPNNLDKDYQMNKTFDQNNENQDRDLESNYNDEPEMDRMNQ
ncbi:UNKNOWN [Stylonychia lemnae]|uniref:Uncharacterized protein n=1 Tax=Stylonychia lemnae TaxID=5949 RepID=A0A078ARW0_STYLE|nr:UNKNOWN [Stylonychia lemnae]|eukprot:CDW84721.1 UNKNOWN [Stylonychia lemnae]